MAIKDILRLGFMTLNLHNYVKVIVISVLGGKSETSLSSTHFSLLLITFPKPECADK